MSVIGTVAAAATFAFTGNPQAAMLAYSVVSSVDALVNAPDQNGPRLEDLRVQMSSYGAPIPFGYGTVKQTGTVFWPKELLLEEQKHSESAKGGPEMNTYTYTGSFAVLIRHGRIAGVRRMWKNKKLVYDRTPGSTVTQDPGLGTVRFYLGTDTQEPDPLMEAKDGPSPAYLDYAYVMFEDSDMTDTQGRIAQWEFEVVTDGESEIPQASTFGEEYGQTSINDTFSTAVDPRTGHVWISTMAGRAALDLTTGKYSITPGYGPVPQIQEYDPITKEILYVIEPQPVIERNSSIYPMAGTVAISGGYMFIGRGSSGFGDANTVAQPYAHGAAVHLETRAFAYLYDECSHEQFQNAFYWPSVPIPVIGNNKVFMAGGTTGSNIAIGFMPASFISGGTTTYPQPNGSAGDAVWNAPAGWRQARAESPCPLDRKLEGTFLYMESLAVISTVIDHDRTVIVQGRMPSGGMSYLSWVSHATMLGGASNVLDLSGPSNIATVYLPSSTGRMPTIAWDAKTETLWAFADAGGGQYRQLYAIRNQGASIENTGFAVAEIDGAAFSGSIEGLSVDPTTGALRVLAVKSSSGIAPARTVIMEIDPIAFQVVSTHETSLASVNGPGVMIDYPEQGKVIYANGFKLYDIPYGSPLTANPVQLGAIVADLCQRAGLAANDIDVSQLTDMVDGYIVPRQMSARAAIEPLQTAFYFDAVESDDKLKFVKRAASAPIQIPMEDRAARDFGADLPDSLSITRAQDYELPVQCDVEYADIDADHLVGNQYERRITKDTKQRINIQSPVVMTAAKAKEVAMVTLYRAWLNQSYKFSTTRKWAHLEPTDFVSLPTNEASYTARITSKREQPSGIIEWEAAMESVEVYTQVPTGAAPTNYVKQTIYDPGSTTLQLLDIPILRDADNDGGAYVAMAGTGDGWKGAQLFKSSDSGSTYESVLTQANEAAIGFTQSVLPDFTGGNIFDAGSSVTVFMTSGQPLTSATEDQVLNGANLAVIGRPGRWEVFQYTDANLIAPNTYLLGGRMLRGRRGTEWATGLHQSSDAFILASVATWSRLEAEDLGLPRLFKAPPFRTPLSGSAAQSFTNTAVGLKPFAPVDLTGVRDESGNLTLAWHRRTRMKSDTLHLPTPLGEASESYSIDIIKAGAAVRTLTSSTPSVAYSAANQTADGITPGDAVTVSITQVSATVGKGYPLEGTV